MSIEMWYTDFVFFLLHQDHMINQIDRTPEDAGTERQAPPPPPTDSLGESERQLEYFAAPGASSTCFVAATTVISVIGMTPSEDGFSVRSSGPAAVMLPLFVMVTMIEPIVPADRLVGTTVPTDAVSARCGAAT